MKVSARAVAGAVAALVLTGVASVAPASAAPAAPMANPSPSGCTALGTKGDSSSLSWTRAKSNDCAGNVQARVMRYIANYPTITDGPKSRNSYVSATGGVSGAGHGLRIQISAGSSSWNDWMYF